MSKATLKQIESFLGDNSKGYFNKLQFINSLDKDSLGKASLEEIEDWQHKIDQKRKSLTDKMRRVTNPRTVRNLYDALLDYSCDRFATHEEKSQLRELYSAYKSGSSRDSLNKYAKELRDKYLSLRYLHNRGYYNATKNRSVAISDLTKDSLYSEITLSGKGYFVHCKEVTSADWNYYSKSWHRSHGPKVTVESREVVFTSKKTLKVEYSHTVDSWRGNYILDAVASFLKLSNNTVKVAKQYRKVQLDQRLSIDLIREFNGVQIWKRSLGNIAWDYCVLSNRETYHASTIKRAITGLREKRSTRQAKDLQTIDYHKGIELGFCDTGMRSFAKDNNLDIDATYSIKALRGIVLQNRNLNYDRYGKDLSKIGIIVNRSK